MSRNNITKENCLANKRPDVAKQWHPTKNLPLTPHSVTNSSEKMIWWKCSKCGREWLSMVYCRTRKGASLCHICSKKSKKATSKNSLFAKRPMLAKDWHPTKNGKMNPKNITYGSEKIAWWKCHECGHEWEDRICDRLSGNGCKKCNLSIIKDQKYLKNLI